MAVYKLTIDNDLIGRNVRSLSGVIAIKEKEINGLQNIINGLSYVRKEEDTDPNPVDDLTGNVISDERMQEIYDNCMAKANAILDSPEEDS